MYHEFTYWFRINGLALNPDNTTVVVFGTHRRSEPHIAIDSINVAGVAIQPSNQVKLLGVVLDEKLMLTAHVGALCKATYFHIRALRHIRKTLSIDNAKTVASALVGFRLDYANSMWYGASAASISKSQRIQNSLARVVTFAKPRAESSRELLIDLH